MRSTPRACIRCCWRSAANATRRSPTRRRPQELLTTANAILGQGQLSLAKYLWIAAREDDSALDIHDIPAFFATCCARVDWTRDLHFQTRTTIDTLDYSGDAINEGSKLVIAAVGPAVRELPTGRRNRTCRPALARRGFACRACWRSAGRRSKPSTERRQRVEAFCAVDLRRDHPAEFPLWVIVDDADFAARTLNNFLWITFTRSNPATDVYGVDVVHRTQTLGLPRTAGDRRPGQAASCTAAGRRPGSVTACGSTGRPRWTAAWGDLKRRCIPTPEGSS